MNEKKDYPIPKFIVFLLGIILLVLIGIVFGINDPGKLGEFVGRSIIIIGVIVFGSYLSKKSKNIDPV